jgi:Methyltransferase domain
MKILARLKAEPGLCVLDIGPTSPNNINFLTNLGHSVYMADLVEEAVKPDWLLPAEDDGTPRYDIEGFLARHMDFGNREFDIVLLWDAFDYIPGPLADAILRRLKVVMRENGQVLAFFHSRMTGPETTFCRYHVMDGDTIETQQGPSHPVLRNYQNRQIEALFQDIGACRFLLAKDNTREVIVTR